MAASSAPGSEGSRLMLGFLATMASGTSWKARSERKSDEPPISRTRGRRFAPISPRTVASFFGTRGVLLQQPLFLQLLAVDAEHRPGHGLQAALADGHAAIRADGVGAFLHPVER